MTDTVTKEKLVADFKVVVADAEELLRVTAGQAGEKAAELRAKVQDTDTVFVFAQAPSGPRMPLAVMRAQVKDLPLEYTLDDSMAMNPAMTLSSLPEVIVVARVAKGGGPMAQSGDLQGRSGPIRPAGGAAVDVLIGEVVP